MAGLGGDSTALPPRRRGRQPSSRSREVPPDPLGAERAEPTGVVDEDLAEAGADRHDGPAVDAADELDGHRRLVGVTHLGAVADLTGHPVVAGDLVALWCGHFQAPIAVTTRMMRISARQTVVYIAAYGSVIRPSFPSGFPRG